MLIEFITPYFYPLQGGIEVVVGNLASLLTTRGHVVIVHTANKIPNSATILPETEKKDGFTIKRYKYIPSYGLFFPKLVHKNSIISMHNYSSLANDYIAFLYRSHKKTLTPYGTITYDISQRSHKIFSHVYDTFIGSYTLSNIDNVIAMTNFEKNKILKKYPKLKDSISVIAAGVSLPTNKFFTSTVLKKYKIDYKYFLSIGRIGESKRYEDILRILPYYPKYHYILAGEDLGYLHFLEDLATKLQLKDRFHYVGKISNQEKNALLTKASLFLMPSLAEAFSIASLEAFYFSDCVIAADSGGLHDLFTQLSGSLYSVGDLNALKSKITTLLETPVSLQLKIKRKRIIESTYSWEAIADKYENLFKTI